MIMSPKSTRALNRKDIGGALDDAEQPFSSLVEANITTLLEAKKAALAAMLHPLKR
jgi:hypothetical protein